MLTNDKETTINIEGASKDITMTREKIREMTMQIIFQMDVNDSWDYTEASIMEEHYAVLDEKQAIRTLEVIRDNISEIDELIAACTDNWNADRIAKTEKAILRNAVAEMKFIDEIPNVVAINEAVNLAKKYGDDKSYAFVNSVLRKVNGKIEA